MRILAVDHGSAHASYFCGALAAAGNDVVLVTAPPAGAVQFDRRVRLVHANVLAVDQLDKVIRDHPADVVYLMSERLMEFAHDLPTDVAQNIFPKVNDFQRLHIEDRRKLYSLLRESGLVIPEVVDIKRDEDLLVAIQRFGFPLVVRGTAGCAGLQVRIVHSADALETAIAQIRSASPSGIFVQRFVDGHRCIVGALCVDGEAKQLIAQRVLDTFPNATSPSIVNRSFHSESLVAVAERVFRLLNWNGFASADFIEDSDGQFYFLELNPRLWGSVQVAEVCGVPMIDAFARLIDGRAQLSRRSAQLNRTVFLFPQYIAARLAQGRVLRMQEVVPVLRCLADAPPGLLNVITGYLRRSGVRLKNAAVSQVRRVRYRLTLSSKP